MRQPEAMKNVVDNVSSCPPKAAELRQIGGMKALEAVGNVVENVSSCPL